MIPFPQIGPFNNLKKLVSLIGDTIYIQAHKLGYSFDYYYDELLFDLFSTYYTGQKIVIVASDGENLVRRGVVNFFDDLCNKGIVPRDLITFISHDMHWDSNFKHEKLSYGPWFTQINEYINSAGNFNSVNPDAKFVGCLISRFTPTRFKLAYQLDQGFPDDNFLTFRGHIDSIKEFYSTIDLDNTYQDQVDWISCPLKEGISTENAKKIAKFLRDEGPKSVKSQIQGDELRVTSKSRDDLQATMAMIKEGKWEFAVQFVNFR